MGAFAGSMTYARLFAAPLDETGSELLDALQLRAFRRLKASDEDDERVGWVSIHHPFDTELDHAKVFSNEYLNLGLRIDRYRIPGAILKAHLADATAERLDATGQSKLSRSQREDVKAMVVRRLREQFPPTMRVIDVSMNVRTGEVRVFSHSTKVQETLIELFETTFRTGLVHDAVYVRAQRLGFSDEILDVVASLEPTRFHLTEAA